MVLKFDIVLHYLAVASGSSLWMERAILSLLARQIGSASLEYKVWGLMRGALLASFRVAVTSMSYGVTLWLDLFLLFADCWFWFSELICCSFIAAMCIPEDSWSCRADHSILEWTRMDQRLATMYFPEDSCSCRADHSILEWTGMSCQKIFE